MLRAYQESSPGAGDATEVVMRTVFPTRELRDQAVEHYGAIEGGRQTLGQLAHYIAGRTQDAGVHKKAGVHRKDGAR